ncbi:MAG TPA: hypothetical protein VMB70_03040, partial [Terriglobia bacterium]|nr:hypothetical protein [Terriglobia bacterium]
GASLRIGKPTPLFDLNVPGPAGSVDRYVPGTNSGAGYDVLPDGRFVMIRHSDPKDPTIGREIIVVQNWFEELKRPAAAK